MIGRDVKAEDFNGWLLNRILRDKGMPVYTIYAEVEGCAYQHNFADPETGSPGRRDILPFKRIRYQGRCRSGKAFAEILLAVKAGCCQQIAGSRR